MVSFTSQVYFLKRYSGSYSGLPPTAGKSLAIWSATVAAQLQTFVLWPAVLQGVPFMGVQVKVEKAHFAA